MKRAQFGFDAAKRFFAELLDSVETLGGIGEVYGADTLAELMYLHRAILEGSRVDIDPDSGTATLGIIEGLPSYGNWIKFVKTPFDEDETKGADKPETPAKIPWLRTDVPDEILEMLLFEGEPKFRSRVELEDRFATVATIPYMRKWLGCEAELTARISYF